MLLSLAVSAGVDDVISGWLCAQSPCNRGSDGDRISFTTPPGVTCVEISNARCAFGKPHRFLAQGRGVCCRAWRDLRQYIDGLGDTTTVAVVVVADNTPFSSFDHCDGSLCWQHYETGCQDGVWTCLKLLGFNLTTSVHRQWMVEGAKFVVMLGSRCVQSSRAWAAVGHVAASVERWVYVSDANGST